jgi:hypothetical protein
VCGRTNPDGVALDCAGNGVVWFDRAWLAG